jgi:hypothetical protein
LKILDSGFRPEHHAVQGFRRNDGKRRQANFFTPSANTFFLGCQTPDAAGSRRQLPLFSSSLFGVIPARLAVFPSGDAIVLGPKNEMIEKGSAHNQKKLDHSFLKIRADKFQKFQSFRGNHSFRA